MNRNERNLLRDAVNAVVRHSPNAWWELKRQIFEGGYQAYYPAQGDFDGAAERAVAALPADTKTALVDEWRKAKPTRPDLSDSGILDAYARVVVEEVVRRARVAANRTENW